MITRVEIQNYRSIWQATVPLSPFTLLIGANGTGKSNFLKLLQDLSSAAQAVSAVALDRHFNHLDDDQRVNISLDSGKIVSVTPTSGVVRPYRELLAARVFSIDPVNAGKTERLIPNPSVKEDGSGVVQVLDALKTGDKEHLFEEVERTLSKYIPEIEKLSFIPGQATKQLQVREKYIEKPIPVAELSEGTRLVLTILTIIYQENPPSVICLEEIDRGMHPRLFEQVVQLCFDMTRREGGPQIIATTHNPYLVDQFKDHEEAVVIVEKENGETTFTTLAERLRHLQPDEEPLGSLWYSGFVGGVPDRRAALP